MPNYHVTWEIDLEAESVEQAARKARAIQLDPDNIASVFDVDNDGHCFRIDLHEIQEIRGIPANANQEED